jgi:hypothetical protein
MAKVSSSLRTRPEYINRCEAAGTLAYSSVASLFFRSRVVVERGNVNVHFALPEDLMLKVTETSSGLVGDGSVIFAAVALERTVNVV